MWTTSSSRLRSPYPPPPFSLKAKRFLQNGRSKRFLPMAGNGRRRAEEKSTGATKALPPFPSSPNEALPFSKSMKRFGGFENIDLGPLPPVSRNASGAKAASHLKVKRFVQNDPRSAPPFLPQSEALRSRKPRKTKRFPLSGGWLDKMGKQPNEARSAVYFRPKRFASGLLLRCGSPSFGWCRQGGRLAGPGSASSLIWLRRKRSLFRKQRSA